MNTQIQIFEFRTVFGKWSRKIDKLKIQRSSKCDGESKKPHFKPLFLRVSKSLRSVKEENQFTLSSLQRFFCNFGVFRTVLDQIIIYWCWTEHWYGHGTVSGILDIQTLKSPC